MNVEFLGEFRPLRIKSRYASWPALALIVACGGRPEPAEAPSRGQGDVRDTRIVHEPCETEGPNAIGQDVNGDKRSDLTRVVIGGVERCRGVDLDFDGRMDVWVYRDATGKVRRRESDYDRDGRIDEIGLYRAGELIERHRATILRGQLDTWHTYDRGRLTRTVRDSDGDAMIDQWWEYTRADEPQCALVHTDADRDGRPDPGSTIDLCADSTMEYPRPDEEPTLGFGQSSELPVELETPPEAEAESDPAQDGSKPAEPAEKASP